jgi:ribosomal protein S18 acetylase RimI-like enzyme
VAVVEENVLGYVLARAQPDIFPGYDAEIIALHVQKPFQKQGIGKALFRTAAKRLMDASCKSTMLWTLKRNPTRHWYEKLGGIFLAEKSDEIDGWIVNEVAYGWNDITSLLAIL